MNNNGPYIFSKLSTKRINLNILLALLPITFYFIIKDINTLIPLGTIVITTYLSGILLHYLFHHQLVIDDLSTINIGLILTLLLPTDIPFYFLIIGSISATAGKFISKDLLNPPLIGFIVIILLSLLFRYSINFPGYDLISIILVIGGLIYLILTKSIKYEIVISYLLMIVTIFIIMTWKNSLPIDNLLEERLLLTGIFLLMHHQSTPITQHSMIIYGLFIGIVTAFIYYHTLLPSGIIISILTANLFTHILDYLILTKRRIFIIIPYSILLILFGITLLTNISI